MKRLIIALLLIAPAALAQTVSFQYVAPTTAINSAFGAGSGWTTGLPANYTGVPITAANAAQFTAAAPPNVLRTYQQMQPGIALRNRVDQILQISGGRVDPTFYLVDDRTGLGASAGFFAPWRNGGNLYVWPAASNWPVTGTSPQRYAAAIFLGERACAQIQTWPGAWRAWEGTIIHETSHTQFVGEKTKWGMIRIVYGGDNNHYTSELLGEQELPWEEGLGTFFGGVHIDPVEMNQTRSFFVRADRRYELESRSFLAGTASVWNAPHDEEERDLALLDDPAARTGGYVVRRYRWQDVPGFYILFSESTSTAFNLYFWRKVNNDRDAAYRMIVDAVRGMWQERRKRYLTYEINRLALQMEAQAATPQGQTARTAGTLTSSMFPFALLDILTHFGMSDAHYQADYRRNYADREPRAATEYWARRATVRALVQPHLTASPVRIDEAIDAAHRYFQQPDTILTPATP